MERATEQHISKGRAPAHPALATSPVSESQLEKAARYHVPILISGESGTGKEVLARRIHDASARSDGPFVAINCGALPASLLESQLFGHVKGAFTGADREAKGFLRAGDGGTVLLDEVGELPQAAQVALLRCLQERTVVPVGAAEPIPVDIRVIAATNRAPEWLRRGTEFRTDLFYRLNVIHFHLSPLRERRDELPQLVDTLMHRISTMHEEPPKAISRDALDRLRAYPWPGNVRELANAIEHGFVMAETETVTPDDLPPEVRAGDSANNASDLESGASLAEAERALLRRALQQAQGDKQNAAALLGIQRQTLYRLIRRLEV